jgi:SAM-dependent methyltransferase
MEGGAERRERPSELYTEHVDLYDLAFDWDVGVEVAWLVARMGPRGRTVLEPGCGSGRIVESLARLGLDVCGIDLSPAMVAAARRRLERAGVAAEIVLADMCDFDLGRRFGGAVCPIGTLGLLRPPDLVRHLVCMGGHLEPGAAYLVQLPHYGPEGGEVGRADEWEESRGGVEVRVTWTTEAFDVDRMRERQRSRIEVVSGPRAGEVIEERHELTFWTPDAWEALLAPTPFVQAATYDGDLDDRPRVPPGTLGTLLWHELRLEMRGSEA